MGADHGPAEVVAGAKEAQSPTVQPLIVGPSGLDTQGLELIEASEVIEMDEKPTGAMLAASLKYIRRLDGVLRPAIAVVLPARDGTNVLVDAGANADGRPEHLFQFAHMGAILSREVLGVAHPHVRLLSIGDEPEKGNQLTLETHALLAGASGIDFRGNTEGRNLLSGGNEVIVTDGFTGNVVLKLLEGTIRSVLE